MHTNVIGFPGFGIGPFNINTIAFTVFGRDIAWYGIFVTIGILGGIFYAFWRGYKNNGIIVDDMIDVAIFSIPAAIIGARIYYIVFNLKLFPTLYSTIEIWNGGLAVYGGIIAGLVTALAVCKFKKLSVLKVFDSVAPAIMFGQIIGRWGNFTNAEAYGTVTNLPWRMAVNDVQWSNKTGVHPTFLYESLWNLLGFIIINLLYKKKKFDGQIFLMYAAWYGFGRMLIEGLRTDSLYLGKIRISQFVGALCFVAGMILLIIFLRKAKIKRLESEGYDGVFTSAIGRLPDDDSDAKYGIEDTTDLTDDKKIEKKRRSEIIENFKKHTDDTESKSDNTDKSNNDVEKTETAGAAENVVDSEIPAKIEEPETAENTKNTETAKFNIIIKSAGDKQSEVIKALRDLTGLDLKDAIDLANSDSKPIKESVSQNEAEQIKETLTKAGAEVEIVEADIKET
ncbi:MAG: prolipoprotein diacylglyceryl transferase [Oscillospiraceae bacterium]|nr:prolipoprotein diacylglyceryl transferase [Oscillospiraceae bacterium]